jgi:hypothetical protein
MVGLEVVITILFWVSVAGILYTYVGYPLLLALLVGLHRAYYPATSCKAEDLPKVTLPIAAYNEQETIACN